MLKRNSKKMNIILFLICCLLLGVIAFLFITNQKKTQEVSLRVEEEIRGTASAEEPQKSRENQNSKEVKTADDSVSKDNEKKEKLEHGKVSITVTPTPEVSKEEMKGIACWGDDLMNASTTEKYSYMAVLQRLLKENGYDLPVVNKTIQGGGTLSMMKMAGVSDSVLQGYIKAHEQAANGAELYITEKGIRDLTEEQTERNDLECIPVIFMGYYGGWNHDPKELGEQQENILKTFPDQERFLVVGTRPVDGTVDAATLDAALQEKWQEHYISLAQTTIYPASTIEAQEAMAQAILQKMEELKYIGKNSQVKSNEKTDQTP